MLQDGQCVAAPRIPLEHGGRRKWDERIVKHAQSIEIGARRGNLDVLSPRTGVATLDSQASATTYSALIEVNLTRPICTISGTVTSQVGLNTVHTVRFHLATYDEPSHESIVAQNGGGGIFADIFWMIWAIYFLITNAIRDPYFRIFAALLGFGMLFMTRHPDYVLILGIAQAAATLYQVVRLMGDAR